MDNPTAEFKIWGADDTVYGPVDLLTLVAWVKDERVTGDTWVFQLQKESWQKARTMPELTMFFAGQAPGPVDSQIRPGTLRRVKVLADMTDDQLTRFASFMETVTIRQWTHLVKQGSPGGDMYLLLEGEMRVRLMIGGKETIIATLAPGECFGEMSLFDDAPRSADVVSNCDCVLLKISCESFAKMHREAPELAAPFLLALGKTLAGRIRADNKRIKDAVSFARSGGY